MRYESFDGIVVRSRETGDHDLLLSVVTAERGRLTVLSKGGKSIKGEQRPISQLFAYANFEVYRRGDLYILKGGVPLHSFYGITDDIHRFNLAAYLCDLTVELTDEGEPAEDMMRLLLNALYALGRGLYPLEILKAAFEFRAAVLSGYAPWLDGCSVCKKRDAEHYCLDTMNGVLLCPDCLHKRSSAPRPTLYGDELREAELLLPLTAGAVAALSYTARAPIERLFAFELKDAESLQTFSHCTERYLLAHLERGFDTLDFYRLMRENDTKGTKL